MRRPIIAVTSLLILLILIADYLTGYSFDIMETYENQRISICGQVVKVSYKDDGYYQFVVNNVRIMDLNNEYNRKVLVSVYSDVDDYLSMMGKCIRFEGEISIPKERTNPGCFDYRKYLKSINIRTVMKADSYEVLNGKSLMEPVYIVRTKAITAVNSSIGGDRAGVIIGMIFGDTDYISDDTMEMFRKGGTAHILAVSGLHIGIIYSFLLKFRRKKKNIAYDVGICFFLFLYSALCCFAPSVMRAVMMIYIHIAGKYLDRRYDFLSCICASMIILLLFNPWQIYNTGFQMSYLAALTIAVIMPALKKKIDGVMLPIITVQIGMLPYTAYTFNYISLSSLICNIPIAYLSAIMIPAGVLLLPLCFFGIEEPVLDVMGFMAGLLLSINDYTYADGLFNFDCISPPIWFLALFYSMLFFFCSEAGKILILRKDKQKIRGVVMAVLAFTILIGSITYQSFSKAEYLFVDVGQGDCLHIREKGCNILIDGGGNVNYNVGEKILKPYLLKNGVGHVDIAVVTHLHTDHYQGIIELSKCYRIDTLAVYEGNKGDEEKIRRECNVKSIIYLKKGESFKFGENGCVEVLAPEGGITVDSDNENDSSLILRILNDGVSVLMTADIDEEGERKLIASCNSKCDSTILKIAHHGSSYSSCLEFIETVNPEAAVICVGKNNYGHPSDETLKRLETKGISLYRTDCNGAVGIDTDKKKIITMRRTYD